MIDITGHNIQQVLAAARRASTQIMAHYKKPLEITNKEDDTPVTNADMASHIILAEDLPRVINIPVLSEEGEDSVADVAQWTKFWVVDPLDGTKGFIQQTDEFAINIAIVENQRAVFGMLYVPVTQQAYYAVQGRGAFKLHGEEWQKIVVAPKNISPEQDTSIQDSSKIKTLGSRRHSPSPRVQRLCDLLGDCGYISIGSAIKFAVIAEGGAHLYPRFGPSSWWDTAAGQCIVEEAGGMVVDADLQPLIYKHSDNFLSPNFIAAAFQDEAWDQAWTKINTE